MKNLKHQYKFAAKWETFFDVLWYYLAGVAFYIFLMQYERSKYLEFIRRPPYSTICPRDCLTIPLYLLSTMDIDLHANMRKMCYLSLAYVITNLCL